MSHKNDQQKIVKHKCHTKLSEEENKMWNNVLRTVKPHKNKHALKTDQTTDY